MGSERLLRDAPLEGADKKRSDSDDIDVLRYE